MGAKHPKSSHDPADIRYYFEFEPIKDDPDGKMYWRFKSAANGETMAYGEAHRDTTDAVRSAQSIAKAMAWVHAHASGPKDDRFFRVLKAG